MNKYILTDKYTTSGVARGDLGFETPPPISFYLIIFLIIQFPVCTASLIVDRSRQPKVTNYKTINYSFCVVPPWLITMHTHTVRSYLKNGT
jgi:hypothetical protein